MTPRIYIASKMKHAEKWRALYSDPSVHIVSRWPFLEPYVDPSPANARLFWQDDIADIKACDVLIVYAEESEHLRGALVEAGVALALGKMVIVVGQHDDYGTWQHHPKVLKARTIDSAITVARINHQGERKEL